MPVSVLSYNHRAVFFFFSLSSIPSIIVSKIKCLRMEITDRETQETERLRNHLWSLSVDSALWHKPQVTHFPWDVNPKICFPGTRKHLANTWRETRSSVQQHMLAHTCSHPGRRVNASSSASKLRTHIWANIGYYNSGQQTTEAFKESPPQHFTEYYYNCHQQFCQKSENCKGQNLTTEEQGILKNCLAVCWHVSVQMIEKCWTLLLTILQSAGGKLISERYSSTPLPLRSCVHSR